MLTLRIIPCLDFRNGRVVKGVQFSHLRDAGDPAELAAEYEAQGADELVILDVAATLEGRGTDLVTVRRVRAELSIPLTVGGGVRSIEDVQALLESGADKVSFNTSIIQNHDLVGLVAGAFGCQCIVAALDARRVAGGKWEAVIHSGQDRTGQDAVEWAKEAVNRGAGEILLTSWDRDGTRSGYDLELISAVAAAVKVPIIASGGAASPQHFVEAANSGASAVLAASIFHDGDYTVAQIKQALHEHGILVRL